MSMKCEAKQYTLINLCRNGQYEQDFILHTPRSRKVYSSYAEAKAAFNQMKKAKEWILFHIVDGKSKVYVNHQVGNPDCIVCTKI